MKKNIKNHHAGRIISLSIVLCMVLAIAPMTAFAEDTVYNHTYHTKVKLTANVTLQDSDGNTVNTYNVSEEGDFVEGNVSDDAVQAEITRLEAVVKSQLPSGAVKSNRTTSTTFDHFESSYILESSKDHILVGDNAQEEGESSSTLDVHEYQIYEITDEWTVKPATQKEIKLIEINNATLIFKDGDKPVFTGTTPDGAPYVLDYECWFGADGKFICSSDYWNSAYVERDWCDGLVSSFKANTEYTYGLYLKLTDEAAARGYVFGPNTKLEVNGKAVECQQSGETGIAVQIRTQLTMKPTTPTTQKEIPVVEINNATLTFKDGDKPVFTGTTPNNAPYVLVFEEWRTDGEWTCSEEWFNDAEHHGSDKDITAFDKNKTYNYNLYIKINSKGADEGWDFGPNTKLKINGKEVSFTNDDPDAIQVFMVTTGITMTPTSDDAPDYKIIEGANGTWTQNSDETLVFRANGDFSKFTDVLVDDELVDEKNYTAVSGSTIVTLKADYLNTLSVGTHKLTIVYNDGECSTNFEIVKATANKPGTDTNAPSKETGDNSNLIIWFAVLFVSAISAFGIVMYGKRKKKFDSLT